MTKIRLKCENQILMINKQNKEYFYKEYEITFEGINKTLFLKKFILMYELGHIAENYCITINNETIQLYEDCKKELKRINNENELCFYEINNENSDRLQILAENKLKENGVNHIYTNKELEKINKKYEDLLLRPKRVYKHLHKIGKDSEVCKKNI